MHRTMQPVAALQSSSMPLAHPPCSPVVETPVSCARMRAPQRRHGGLRHEMQPLAARLTSLAPYARHLEGCTTHLAPRRLVCNRMQTAAAAAAEVESDTQQQGVSSGISSGVRLENISKTFKGQQVLKDINWDVKKGERVGLVGTQRCDALWIMCTRVGCSCISPCRRQWRGQDHAAADHHRRAAARHGQRGQGQGQPQDRLLDAGIRRRAQPHSAGRVLQCVWRTIGGMWRPGNC